MNISKYIIALILAILVVLAILLAIMRTENKSLQRVNTLLKEQVAQRDTVIAEIDKNIAALKQQVLEADAICNERLKARSDVIWFLNKDSPQHDIQPAASQKKEQANSWKGLQSPAPFHLPRFQGQVTQKRGSASLEQGLNMEEVIDDEKSIFAIDNINNYWVQFTRPSSSKE